VRLAKARGGVTLATFLLVLAAPVAATAQQPPASHAAAVSLFEEGTRLVTAGDCTEAIGKFRDSLALEPLVGARLDLADCEERLGATEAAWRDFRLAEHLATARSDARAGLARDRSSALQQKLQLVLVARVEGLELRMDGQLVDPELFADGMLAVTPGAHRIEARAPGHEPVTMTLASEGPRARVVAVPPLLPAPVTPTGPAPVPPPVGGAQRTLGLALGGFGILGIATGVVAGVHTLAKRKEAASACGGSYPVCDLANQNAVTSDNSEAQMAGTVSTVGFIVGGLGLAGGALLYLTAPSAEKSSRQGLRVAPMVGSGTTGATLAGRW
jgi:hypothetical protein